MNREDQDQEAKGKRRDWQEFIFYLLAILVVWLLTPSFIEWWMGIKLSSPNGRESLGQFGDLFGAINALFSGVAFAGLLVTIRQQKREHELNRREYRDDRLTQKEQAHQMALANFTQLLPTLINHEQAVINQQKQLLSKLMPGMSQPEYRDYTLTDLDDLIKLHADSYAEYQELIERIQTDNPTVDFEELISKDDFQTKPSAYPDYVHFRKMRDIHESIGEHCAVLQEYLQDLNKNYHSLKSTVEKSHEQLYGVRS